MITEGLVPKASEICRNASQSLVFRVKRQSSMLWWNTADTIFRENLPVCKPLEGIGTGRIRIFDVTEAYLVVLTTFLKRVFADYGKACCYALTVYHRKSGALILFLPTDSSLLPTPLLRLKSDLHLLTFQESMALNYWLLSGRRISAKVKLDLEKDT